ncbi:MULTISPECIES: hypothetical protein [Saccharibacillus]|uniref:hypothetical protein n=1 Tax=Saccharibacillus TaxID=456492 RepID=UPI00123941F2|nr:hypothetical protein [Saccharibacillus sp. WB 17]MWJ30597.1 hypothetical protein [Saccharibacillus sp. WB 17]
MGMNGRSHQGIWMFPVGLFLLIVIAILVGTWIEAPTATVYQVSFTLFGVMIAATVSVLILQAQIKAQQDREREKEIIADARQTLKCAENGYVLGLRIDSNLETIKDILMAAEYADDPQFNKEFFFKRYSDVFRRFEEIKTLLDDIDSDSLPPGRMFTEFLDWKLHTDVFSTIASMELLKLDDIEAGKARARHLYKEADEFRMTSKRISNSIGNKAEAAQKLLRLKYKDNDFGYSTAAAVAEKDRFPELKSLWEEMKMQSDTIRHSEKSSE